MTENQEVHVDEGMYESLDKICKEDEKYQSVSKCMKSMYESLTEIYKEDGTYQSLSKETLENSETEPHYFILSSLLSIDDQKIDKEDLEDKEKETLSTFEKERQNPIINSQNDSIKNMQTTSFGKSRCSSNFEDQKENIYASIDEIFKNTMRRKRLTTTRGWKKDESFKNNATNKIKEEIGRKKELRRHSADDISVNDLISNTLNDPENTCVVIRTFEKIKALIKEDNNLMHSKKKIVFNENSLQITEAPQTLNCSKHLGKEDDVDKLEKDSDIEKSYVKLKAFKNLVGSSKLPNNDMLKENNIYATIDEKETYRHNYIFLEENEHII